jgi:hypothetical protein
MQLLMKGLPLLQYIAPPTPAEFSLKVQLVRVGLL